MTASSTSPHSQVGRQRTSLFPGGRCVSKCQGLALPVCPNQPKMQNELSGVNTVLSSKFGAAASSNLVVH